MAKDRKPSLLDVLSSAAEADLLEIDSQIAAKEQQLADTTKAAEADLASLRQLRRVVDVKLHGRPARKVRQPKAAKVKPAANGQPVDAIPPGGLAAQIIGILDRGTGVAPLEYLAQRTGHTAQGLNMAITKCAQLKRLPDGRIAIAGYRDDDE